MGRRVMRLFLFFLCGLLPLLSLSTPAPAWAQSSQPAPVDSVRIQPVLTGLKEPWSLAFLPDGGFLISERGGRLSLVKDGRAQPVEGTPTVYARGQGGLLDVVVARDFAKTRAVFLSFAQPRPGGAGTALATAHLSADETSPSLENLRVIFAMRRATSGDRHFGSRIVEAPDGNLFLTIGERGEREKAQSLEHHNGKVIRVARDGAIPPGNPFAADSATASALPEIWSYGHRNPQGAALDLAGNLVLHEHGARGGDEVNAIRAGANYGWPVIAYGRHYWGGKIGEGAAKPGMEQPLHYWDPSIAPSGMLVYSGKLWPHWRGDVFVGSLKFDYLARLDPEQGWREAGRITSPQTARVRDVREAPDGSIWFLSVGNGAVYKITPE